MPMASCKSNCGQTFNGAEGSGIGNDAGFGGFPTELPIAVTGALGLAIFSWSFFSSRLSPHLHSEDFFEHGPVQYPPDTHVRSLISPPTRVRVRVRV